METFLALLFGNALIVGSIGYLLKLWVEKRLSHSLDLRLEKFKSELVKEVARDSIQQQWVNDKRMELFGQMNHVLGEMDLQLKMLFLNVKSQVTELAKERAYKFCEKYCELNAVLHRNEIFLDPKIVQRVREVYTPYFDIAVQCFDDNADTTEAMEELRRLLPGRMEDITDLADAPRKQIVDAFRQAAGVSNWRLTGTN